jgi:PAS domain-containing protein
MPPQPDLPDQPAPGVQPIDADRLADLRSRAAMRLTGGAAGKGHGAGAADALAVLHALASYPATAADALTLLHELQVHQVELDLQSQELRDARAELELALRRQTELYDFQPVGSFTVDARMVVHELNQTGAQLLGIGRDEAYGLPLDAFFGADSARRFRSAIASVDAGGQRASCGLTLCPRQGREHPVLASIGKDPAAQRYLVSLTESGDNPAPIGAA